MDLRKQDLRLDVIADIKTPENKDRKDQSFRATEVFNGRIRQFVYEYLRTQFSSQTCSEAPISSSINLARRITKERSSIYNEPPTRHFSGVEEEQERPLQALYKDMGADHLMSKANEFYCLQNQCMVQIFPADGRLQMRVLKLHHFDVLPDPNNPEEMVGVIINSFDKSNKRSSYGSDSPMGNFGLARQSRTDQSDGIDQSIADDDDQLKKERYEVWTKGYYSEGEYVPALNFIMNGKGEVLSEDPLSPIDGLPFVDICSTKDYQFYASEHNAMVDFSIEYNALMTEIAMNHRMQSWSQAWMKGPKDLLPSTVEVGPTKVIMLPADDEGATDFGFATPGGGSANGIEYAETLLAQFLSTHGIDPQIISSDSGQKYSSGIERLLAMIEKFESSKSDFQLFERVEHKIFEVVKLWLEALQDTGTLDDKYKMPSLPGEASFAVAFNKPEGAQTFSDKVNMQERLIEMGLSSRVTATMDLYNMPREEAEEYLVKVEEDESMKLIAEASSPAPQPSLPGGESEEPDSMPVESEVQVSQEEMIEKDVVLNGAQVTSMVGIVSSVAGGELPRGTGISILMTAFGLTKEKAEEIMGESGRSFTKEKIE